MRSGLIKWLSLLFAIVFFLLSSQYLWVAYNPISDFFTTIRYTIGEGFHSLQLNTDINRFQKIIDALKVEKDTLIAQNYELNNAISIFLKKIEINDTSKYMISIFSIVASLIILILSLFIRKFKNLLIKKLSQKEEIYRLAFNKYIKNNSYDKLNQKMSEVNEIEQKLIAIINKWNNSAKIQNEAIRRRNLKIGMLNDKFSQFGNVIDELRTKNKLRIDQYCDENVKMFEKLINAFSISLEKCFLALNNELRIKLFSTKDLTAMINNSKKKILASSRNLYINYIKNEMLMNKDNVTTLGWIMLIMFARENMDVISTAIDWSNCIDYTNNQFIFDQLIFEKIGISNEFDLSTKAHYKTHIIEKLNEFVLNHQPESQQIIGSVHADTEMWQLQI